MTSRSTGASTTVISTMKVNSSVKPEITTKQRNNKQGIQHKINDVLIFLYIYYNC